MNLVALERQQRLHHPVKMRRKLVPRAASNMERASQIYRNHSLSLLYRRAADDTPASCVLSVYACCVHSVGRSESGAPSPYGHRMGKTTCSRSAGLRCATPTRHTIAAAAEAPCADASSNSRCAVPHGEYNRKTVTLYCTAPRSRGAARVPPTGVEPATCGTGNRRSIH